MNEQELKAAQLAFVNETVEFYSVDPAARRSFDPQTGTCFYRGPNGTKCAIGRHIPDENYYTAFNSLSVFDNRVFGALPENIQVLTVDFLSDVQILHDKAFYWGLSGLTNQGKDMVKWIKESYHLN